MTIERMAHGTIIQRKYWNTGGIGIAIVAVTGAVNDVAAYIGAFEARRQEDTEQWTINHGAKLTFDEARNMLPRLMLTMSEYGLHYRA